MMDAELKRLADVAISQINICEERGFENKMQYQSKHWGMDDYAIYSKNRFRVGNPVCWLSVMIPHEVHVSSRKVADAL